MRSSAFKKRNIYIHLGGYSIDPPIVTGTESEEDPKLAQEQKVRTKPPMGTCVFVTTVS